MASSKATLFDIRGRVQQFAPGRPPSLIDKFINGRVRECLSRRTYWCDLVKRGSIGVPQGITAGTVSTVYQSPIVTGVGTSWPVSDVVNTTTRDGIFETGNQEVFPSSMVGISPESILLVDVAGVQEIVQVNNVTPNSFWAVFSLPHNQNCTVTQSSIAGWQFRLGTTNPVFTIYAVIDPATLILSQNWEGISVTGGQYTVLKMYYTVVPNLVKFMDDCIVDQQQGIPIFTNVSLKSVNWQDPQRTAGGDPQAFVDLGAGPNGLSLYELWPAQINQRQLQYSVYTDWPELINDTDRLPWFINPDVFYNGALADALRYRNGKEDWVHNPNNANFYEAKFKELLTDAMNADESKMSQEYESTSPIGMGGGPGTLFYQRHVNGWGGGDWSRELGF